MTGLKKKWKHKKINSDFLKMENKIKPRPGFETVKVMHTAEEWEDDERGYWLTKSPQERLEAITKIVHQHIWMMGLPTEMDKTKVERLYATR